MPVFLCLVGDSESLFSKVKDKLLPDDFDDEVDDSNIGTLDKKCIVTIYMYFIYNIATILKIM